MNIPFVYMSKIKAKIMALKNVDANIYISYQGKVHSGFYSGRGYSGGLTVKYCSQDIKDVDFYRIKRELNEYGSCYVLP